MTRENSYRAEDLHFLNMLSKQYPTVQAACTEIINLQAILNLPKGTEHFISDVHGEHEAFRHILHSASGVIREKLEDLFGTTLTRTERDQLATLIYYPEEKLEEIERDTVDMQEWYRITFHRLIEVCCLVSSKYTRSKIIYRCNAKTLVTRQGSLLASYICEMASRLIYIKTVSLLPKHDEVVKLKEELTGELLEYMVCKEIAGKLSTMQNGFDKFIKAPDEVEFDKTYELTHSKDLIYLSYLQAVGRGKRKLPPSTAPFQKIVAKKIVAVSTKIVFVIRNLFSGGKQKLSALYKTAQSRSELVATFLAVLELCKANRVKIEGDSENQEITLVKGHKSR